MSAHNSILQLRPQLILKKRFEESTDTLDAVDPHTPATTDHLWLMTEGTRV